MRSPKRMLPWEIDRAVESLVDFRNLVVTYFSDCKRDFGNPELKEGKSAREVRPEINKRVQSVRGYVEAAAVPTVYTWRSAPMFGAYTQNIDLLVNLFRIGSYEIPPTAVTDILEQAIGVYEAQRVRSYWRMVNPFFWVGLAMGWVGQVPFRLITHMGFDGDRARRTLVGRIFKFAVEASTLAASAVAVFQAFGKSVADLPRPW